ncbi:hypothetical protein [Bifidobacterium callitrichidarum]|uniref:Uncharacterized protein n=1 Tax=Bifidobacterium callitrichidarum TaxID=2052941 RepID=A0A2U2NBW7_9BIFI|nr:hypothetical protein [Bifidobacterium callitrichidarum]PWG66646.1 hypothetical protein DF196_01725 [Bifidobacterium callitrichidarum]
MATKLITLRCGHQERVNVDGPYRIIERRIRQVEQAECPICQGNNDKRWADNNRLIPLRGVHDQCLRAETIRKNTLNRIKVLIDHSTIRDKDAFQELKKQALRIDSAAWWLEHRGDAIEVLARDIEL